MTQFTPQADRVLQARYLRRDAQGGVCETPRQMFRRVATSVAEAERTFGGDASRRATEFETLMSELDFLPNSPTLMNAGTTLGQLSACFVLPVEDSLAGIFDSLKLAALIQQSGGGTGFSFSRLRPQGGWVGSTGGEASGPLSFMKIFDVATDNIRQGGRRRGANMGILRVDHPDIEAFIDAKRDHQSLRNFNLSVGITDRFMEALATGKTIALLDPRSGLEVERKSASTLMHRIAEAAWTSGDPGLIYLDTINRNHPTPHMGEIEATNPCGEVPLLPYEACNLGSVNLSHMVRGSGVAAKLDWEKLARTINLAVRFLDDVIEINRWPDPRIKAAVEGNRKIGLGVMGFAELLILLGIPYGDPQAVSFADELMAFVSARAREASRELASERGAFPNWGQSVFAGDGVRYRNATVTSIAPAGTIGIIAGTSAGIEPLFALAYRRDHVLDGQQMVELNPIFAQRAVECFPFGQSLIEHVQRHGNLESFSGLSSEFRQLFRTALELSPQQHLAIQAAFQKHVDNAVSKTINLPESTPPEEIGEVYRQAWELGLKGVTVYRNGSRAQQVLNLGTEESGWVHEYGARCVRDSCQA